MNSFLWILFILCGTLSLAQLNFDVEPSGFLEEENRKVKNLKGDVESHELQPTPSDDMLALATSYHKKKHGKGHKGVKGHSGHSGHKGKKFGKKHEDYWKKHSNAKGKHSKGHHDSKKYHGDHFKGNKGHKGAKFGKKGHKHKGHVTKGFKNTHHKNEFSKKTKFYDSFDNGGYHKKFGGYKGKYGGSKGNKFEGGKLKGFFKGGKFGKKHHHDKGKHSSKHKGHKGHYEEKGDFGHKSSHSKGGKGKHHYGHSGLHPVYVLPGEPVADRRSDNQDMESDLALEMEEMLKMRKLLSPRRENPSPQVQESGADFYLNDDAEDELQVSRVRRAADDDVEIDMEIEMEEKKRRKKQSKSQKSSGRKKKRPQDRIQEVDNKYDFYQQSNEEDYEPTKEKDLPQVSFKNDVDPEVLAEKLESHPRSRKKPDVLESRKDEAEAEKEDENDDSKPIDHSEYQNMNEDLNENHRPPSEDKFSNDYNESNDFEVAQPKTAADLNYEFTDEDLMEKADGSNEKDEFPRKIIRQKQVKKKKNPIWKHPVFYEEEENEGGEQEEEEEEEPQQPWTPIIPKRTNQSRPRIKESPRVENKPKNIPQQENVMKNRPPKPRGPNYGPLQDQVPTPRRPSKPSPKQRKVVKDPSPQDFNYYTPGPTGPRHPHPVQNYYQGEAYDLIPPRSVRTGDPPSGYPPYSENPNLDLTGSSLREVPETRERTYYTMSAPRMDVPNYVPSQRQFYDRPSYTPGLTQRSYVPRPNFILNRDQQYLPYRYQDNQGYVYES